jgi:hypothetical protein
MPERPSKLVAREFHWRLRLHGEKVLYSVHDMKIIFKSAFDMQRHPSINYRLMQRLFESIS